MTTKAVIEINVGAAATLAHLHALLAEALAFPDYYGATFDAFWDLITEGRLPRRLILQGWSRLEARLPREAKLLQACLDAYQRADGLPPCRVVYS